MTPGKIAKSVGLTGLPEMAALSNKPKTTLSDWFRTNRELFNVVLSGCVNKKLNQSLADIDGLSEHYQGKLNEIKGDL